jgi:putative Mn2+ efflux pump MntP
MGLIEVALIGVGLSMDAFAVAICKGLAMPKLNYKQAFVIALFFGVFQALMPTIGWLLGTQLEGYITSIDHWIAFILLAFIGGKMLFDCFKQEDEEDTESEGKQDFKLDVGELFLLAIATSIDALAVGITFAFLHVDLAISVSLIGVITFCLSFIGVAVGHFFGAKYEKPAQIVGGVVLIIIGVKILLEHLGILF